MDEFIFNEENLRAQLQCAPVFLGLKKVRFFVTGDREERLATERTDTLAEFYFYPHDNSLRGRFSQIVFQFPV